jgi:Fur family ferric uptake transcriptional regulator
MSMTRQRKIILEDIDRDNYHPTADEVYYNVRKVLPKISLGTVYRNLDLLTEKGVLNRLDTGLGPRRYETVKHQHYHVACSLCGRIDDIDMPDLTEVIGGALKGGNQAGYSVEAHRLEFYGLCPDCSN